LNDFSPEIMYASLWRRLGAAIVDQIALTIISGVLGFILGLVLSIVLLSSGVPREAMLGAINVISSLLGLISCWVYFAVMESSESQATFGKMLFSIQVASVQNQPITFARASGRYWGKALFHLLCTVASLFVAGVMSAISIPQMFSQGAEGTAAGLFLFFAIFCIILLILQVTGLLVFYIFTSQKQLMHDLLAKTIVVKKSAGLGRIPT
jgi:uncharacterized RDD family membrane protein YckC